MRYIVPVAVLFFLTVILLFPAWLQNRSRMASLRLVHEAVARGQALDPGMVERLLAPPKRKRFTNWFSLICFFFGLTSLSVGLALAIGAHFYGVRFDPTGQTAAGLMLGALINGTSGLAQTLLGVLALKVFARVREGAPSEGLATWFAQLCLFIGVSGFAVGIALALGAQVLGSRLGLGEQGGAGMMLGALIAGFSGLGLGMLGIVVLRLFGREQNV